MKTLNKQVLGNGHFAKLLSILYIVSFIVSTIFIILAYGPHGYLGLSTTALAWWGTGLILLGWISIILLGNLQHKNYEVYGVFSKVTFRRKKPLLDERQLQVRRRIFEKSYICLAVLTLVTVYTLFFAYSWIGRVASPSLYTLHHHIYAIEWVYWNVPLLVVSLPSLVAAWEKDI
ncbi:MAG TPA: hypothetical protein VMR95_04140 [Candidatus Binatia bacterium]|nr:hypothetical protein [Candidatus Binatia bacterium]